MHVGFDIGGTTARASVFTDDWRQIGSGRSGVREAHGPDQIAQLVVSILEQFDAEIDGFAASCTGIGIGLAGQLSPDARSVVNSPNLGWRDEPFAERLEGAIAETLGELRAKVYLDNDLNASLRGEHAAGAVDDVDEVLAVYAGTGVGGAVLANGELVVGTGGVAGEIGHSKIEPGGRLCGCAERGCVEAYAGGIHLERQVARAAENDREIAEFVTDAAEGPEGIEVDLAEADRRAADVPRLEEIWERATDGLAVVAANACTLLNPAVLLVGGGVLEHCPYFREQFLTKVSPLVLEVARDDLEIRRPSLGEEAGMLGAARLAAKRAK